MLFIDVCAHSRIDESVNQSTYVNGKMDSNFLRFKKTRCIIYYVTSYVFVSLTYTVNNFSKYAKNKQFLSFPAFCKINEIPFRCCFFDDFQK